MLVYWQSNESHSNMHIAGASERYLGYRDFQIALAKMARLKYENHWQNGNQQDGNLLLVARRPESELTAALLEEIQAIQPLTTKRIDTLRKQIAKTTVIDTLRSSLPKLVQGFQLYGSMNRLAGSGTVLDASEYITFEGFVDFLNAYFEYEDFFSYNDLALVRKVNAIAMVLELKVFGMFYHVDDGRDSADYSRWMERR